MASTVEICNLALRLLGARRITSLDDNSEEARACNDVFEFLRDDLLRSHPWNFATVRASIAASSEAPAWGYDFSYPLPTTSLRILEVRTYLDWEVEDGAIVTNESAPLYIRYTKRITDSNAFDSSFTKTLAAYIAFELAERITNSSRKRQLAFDEYQTYLKKAKMVDAQESTPKTLDDGSWVDSRHYNLTKKESWEF